MRVFLRALPLVLLSLGSLGQAASAADQKADDAAAAKKVLTYFDGEWDLTFGDKGGLGHKKTSILMDGYCMQQSGRLVAADGTLGPEFLTVMTYDVDDKTYRVWQVWSGGKAMEGTATWDEAKKILTTNYPRHNVTVTQDFSEPDKERWTWGDASGVNTRQK